jgi:hypothetical protein
MGEMYMSRETETDSHPRFEHGERMCQNATDKSLQQVKNLEKRNFL